MAASSSRATSHVEKQEPWSQALSRLAPAYRDQLQSLASGNHVDILSDFLSLVEISHQECLRKRWKYVRKNGEVVIIRDLFAKITKWLDIFKQVGDQAVQYDPGHAALPWAGIRFVLQMAVNDINKYGRLVEILSEISFIITRCAILEQQFIPVQKIPDDGNVEKQAVVQSYPPETEELRISLVNLYAAVLGLLAQSKHYFDQHAIKRVAAGALKGKIDVEDSMLAVERCRTDVDRCVMLNISARQNDISGQISKLHAVSEDTLRLCERLSAELVAPIARMDKSMMKLADELDRKERLRVLLWLSSEPYLMHHEQAQRGLISGTGIWLLTDPVFRKWRSTSTSSVLWLHGIPGSGKSKLISIAIEESRQCFKNNLDPPAAFFYCSRNANEAERSDPDIVLANIARQISSLTPGGPIFQEAVDIYEERESTGFAAGPLSMNESIKLIINLSCHYPVLTIFVDALDECDPERRSDLLDALETILREAPTLVKLMVSSRDDQDIVWRLKGHMNLELASTKNGDDINLFVEVELDRMISSGKILRQSLAPKELRHLIIERLAQDAHGMFRWASMQLEYLTTLKLDGEIRDRLSKLPPKLEQLYSNIYQEMLTDVTGIRVEVIHLVFKWLICARHQLNTADMIYFARQKLSSQYQDLTEDHVLEFCRNFVTRDVGLDTFRFAHLSVREYLEKQPEYTSCSCHALIAECCLLSAISIYETQRRGILDESGLLGQLVLRTDNTILSGIQRNNLQDWTAFRFRCDKDETLMPAQTYACTYWPYHCEKAEIERTRLPLSRVFEKFMLDQPPIVADWASDIYRLVFRGFQSSYPCLRSEKIRACATTRAAPLVVSCIFGFLEIVEIFVSQTASSSDLSELNSLGSTPLASAIKFRQRSVICAIVGADSKSWNKAIMRAACETWEDEDELTKLLAKNLSVPLWLASWKNSINKTRAVVNIVNANRSQFSGPMLQNAFLLEDYEALLYQCDTVDIPEDTIRQIHLDPETLPLLLDHPARYSLSHISFVKAIAHIRQSQTLKSLLVKRWHSPVTKDMVWQALISSRKPLEFLEVLFEFDHDAPISKLFMEHVFTSCPKIALLQLMAKCEKRIPITDKMARLIRYKEGKSKDTIGLSRMVFPFVDDDDPLTARSQMVFTYRDDPLAARPFLYQTALIDRVPD